MHQALVEAEGKQRLPVEYLDVTQGFLARWKHWLKRKLLGNFKHAYVDVLSRQQSAFNRQVLNAFAELADAQAALAHALRAAARRPSGVRRPAKPLRPVPPGRDHPQESAA